MTTLNAARLDTLLAGQVSTEDGRPYLDLRGTTFVTAAAMV